MKHRYSLDQLSLLTNIANWYKQAESRRDTFLITRRSPCHWYLLDKPRSWTWIAGYAKSAKALVQAAILVDYHGSEYGLTDYGVAELQRLGLIETAAQRRDSAVQS